LAGNCRSATILIRFAAFHCLPKSINEPSAGNIACNPVSSYGYGSGTEGLDDVSPDKAVNTLSSARDSKVSGDGSGDQQRRLFRKHGRQAMGYVLDSVGHFRIDAFEQHFTSRKPDRKPQQQREPDWAMPICFETV
jgi:hypothetical protein